MTIEATYEHHFVTNDGEIFNLIEDEGGTIWGYGHVPQPEFIAEANRWIVHTIGEDEKLRDTTPVEHLWARADERVDEFVLVNPDAYPELAKDAFPVTRVWL